MGGALNAFECGMKEQWKETEQVTLKKIFSVAATISQELWKEPGLFWTGFSTFIGGLLGI